MQLRLELGAAYGQVETETEREEGIGRALAFSVGGTLGESFVLGGGFLNHDVGDAADGYGALGLVGDFYPDPTAGWHLGFFLGVGDSGPYTTGGVVTVHAGYDFWVGKQWSIGPCIRALYAESADDASSKESLSSYQLTMSGVFH